MMSSGECQWVHCVKGVMEMPWTVGGMLGGVKHVGL